MIEPIDQIAIKDVDIANDAVMCDLLEHFMGLATHDNINAPPSTITGPTSSEHFNDE